MQIDVVTKDNTWVGLILGATVMYDPGYPVSDMIAFSANGRDGSSCVDLRTDDLNSPYVNV